MTPQRSARLAVALDNVTIAPPSAQAAPSKIPLPVAHLGAAVLVLLAAA
ncbi:MAG TPA: hypothetical protein VFX05_00525 [Casimicrobiaceae bacterium]|nr:hypothetical protein [Casimicrobiaceae bacterium]